MKVELARLRKLVNQWRKNRPRKNSRLPDSIAKLVEDAFKVASTKEIVEASGLWHGKLREIRNSYEESKAKAIEVAPKPSRQKIKMSEIVLSQRQEANVMPLHTSNSFSKLIACIENDHGFRLRIFSEAQNPGELIQNFLASTSGVSR